MGQCDERRSGRPNDANTHRDGDFYARIRHLGDHAMTDEGFELVMPFVVTKSHGGPFDDDAYCAGWEMGALNAQLRHITKPRFAATIRRDNLAQADLIAMKARWSMTEESVPEEEFVEWAQVTFVRVSSNDSSEGMP